MVRGGRVQLPSIGQAPLRQVPPGTADEVVRLPYGRRQNPLAAGRDRRSLADTREDLFMVAGVVQDDRSRFERSEVEEVRMIIDEAREYGCSLHVDFAC